MDTIRLLADIDALLVTSPVNIRYLTGFSGVSEREREAFVLLDGQRTYLFTSALYREQAATLPSQPEIIEIGIHHPLSEAIREIAAATHLKTIGFEDCDLTVAEHARLVGAVPDSTFVATRERVEAMRRNKTERELSNIRAAAKLTDQCFTFITKRIRPGISETRIAWEIEGFIRSRGGSLAFSPIVAFNAHASDPHYHGVGKDPLRLRSLVLLDFGASVEGYCSDMTRVVFTGTPKPEWANAYEAVLAAQTAAFDALKNGERSGATLDTIARERLTGEGYPAYPHSLGHAVGLDIHESPRLTHLRDETLQDGDIVTLEPGTYIPGAYGIRIEDLVRLRDRSAETLSKSPKNLIIL